MEINTVATLQFLDELTKAKISVKFHNYRTDAFENKKAWYPSQNTFRSFTININNRFFNSVKNTNFDASAITDYKYLWYINDIRNRVFSEINENLKLKIAKSFILNYLTRLESRLIIIRNNFIVSEKEVQSELVGNQNIEKINNVKDFQIFYENRNVNIEIRPEDQEVYGIVKPDNSERIMMEYTLSQYWDAQINATDSLIRYIEPRKKVIEATDDYSKVIDILPGPNTIIWTKSDTDFLELIISLLEVGAIQNITKDLKQKKAIESFSDFFGINIKDPYKKLNAARFRKKEDLNLIQKMQKALEEYYQGLNKKL